MKKYLLLISLNLVAIFLVAQMNQNFYLVARNSGYKILANNDSIRVMGFATTFFDNPNVPGPTLIMNEGDSVEIELFNFSQGAPHTVHLHGLDVNQQNDGVPHLSFSVPHLANGFYYFQAPHAGTYLYHCHVASTIHVQGGMYGLIIVRPPNGSLTTYTGGDAFDHELPLFMSEIDTTWHRDSVMLHPHDTSLAIHIVDIPDYDPQHFLINGYSDQQLVQNQVQLNTNVGKKTYVRLANIGYCGNRIIFPNSLGAKIVATDGRPLPTPEFSDTVYVYPGERYGVLLDPQSTLIDSITVEYISMNNLQLKGTQKVSVEVGGLGIDDIANTDDTYFVYPNPSSTNFSINFTGDFTDDIQVSIYDITGKMVHTELVTHNNYLINTSNWVNGIYHIRFTNNMHFSTQKIVVQH